MNDGFTEIKGEYWVRLKLRERVEALREGAEMVVNLTIPIYTNKFLHPTKKRPDCPMEKDYKQGLRRLMLKELEEGKILTSEIVKKYELKVNIL